MNTKVRIIIFLVICCVFIVGCENYSSSDPNTSFENIDSEEKLELNEAFYVALLDSFCRKHYHVKLKKGTYVNNSIQIKDLLQDANTVRIEGTHSFIGKSSVFNDRMFWATIQIEDNNTFEIDFSREKANPFEGVVPDKVVDEIVGLDRIETGYVPFKYVYNN